MKACAESTQSNLTNVLSNIAITISDTNNLVPMQLIIVYFCLINDNNWHKKLYSEGLLKQKHLICNNYTHIKEL